VREFPLLDLESAWKDLQALLTEIQTLVEILDEDSEQGWPEMQTIRTQVLHARAMLHAFPSTIRHSIAADWAEFERWNHQADAPAYKEPIRRRPAAACLPDKKETL
jgi:hypothetical protein